MLKKCLTYVFVSALFVSSVAPAFAATCTVKVTKKDGTVIESTAEGDTCTLDLNAGTCTCE